MKKRFFLFLLIASFIPAALGAQGVNLAFLEIENLNGTADLDYLKGMISGVLLYDLSTAENVKLVDRRNIDSILDEQRLKLSGLTEGSDALLEMGRLGAADSLLKGSFVFLGTELLISLSLLDTEDGSQKSFTGRGYTENTIHRLAEELVLFLTGDRIAFQDPASGRSILSLKDETPGKITFYSPMNGGEIWLDGEFYGYTSGNIREPILLEDLSPGTHNLMVKMGRDFGMVNLPEFTFEPWHTDVEVKPGKNKVVRDGTVEFNGYIYRAMELVRDRKRFPVDFQGEEELSQEFSFDDRNGIRRTGAMAVALLITEEAISLEWIVTFEDEAYSSSALVVRGEDLELEGALGGVEWSLDAEYTSYGWCQAEYGIRRTDIRQGMYR